MKKVLIPTDFSASASNAIEFALQSSKAIPMEITLLHAFEIAGSTYTDYMGVNKEFSEQHADGARMELHHLKESIEKEHGILVKTVLVKDKLRHAIRLITEEEKFDLLLMGTYGAGESQDRFWGSNTGAEIGETGIPILVVPMGYRWKKPAHILFATNDFEDEPTVLNPLFELAELFAAEIQVVIFTDEDDDTPHTFLDHTRTLPNYEVMLKKKYTKNNITTVQLYGLEFSESLQAHIDQTNTDILVMVTHHRTLWNKLFHPSMTRQMSYHTKIPLLVLSGN